MLYRLMMWVIVATAVTLGVVYVTHSVASLAVVAMAQPWMFMYPSK
jgi:hypothetical protein